MTKKDIYQEITDKIVSLLERIDPNDYQAPFAALAAQGLPHNPVTDNSYNGINIPCLWFDQQDKGFASNHWATFKQWLEKGAQVRKGEKGSPVIFYKSLVREECNSAGESEEIRIPVLKRYTVFNADQVEGYTHHQTVKTDKTDLVTRIATVEDYCAGTGADIRHSGISAFYNPCGDFIQMPDSCLFMDTAQASATEHYYSILLHELTHWTGISHRLDRFKVQAKAKREAYAFEELVAEMGAAFLCSRLGIAQTRMKDHAHYIDYWLKALKNDKTHVFKAAAQATKAVDYLNSLQPSRSERKDGAS